ncbi:hypothetical protein BC831DRAFT_511645 [Entophlyctis helioformis]|nr:hypothetical protein BC831DRAFT_511645 [Entophlyctis helioformis]
MDADTALAETYFACVGYRVLSASAADRRHLMFAPPTVFDRNAHKVPLVVRLADTLWSLGVLASLRAHTRTTTVAFCDAAGDDMDMYLQCYLATRGRVQVVPVYSPASQCNVGGGGGGGGGVGGGGGGVSAGVTGQADSLAARAGA